MIRTALYKASWVSGQVIGISSQFSFTFFAQKIRMGIIETSTMPRQGVAMGQWMSLPFLVSDAPPSKLATGNGILEAISSGIQRGELAYYLFQFPSLYYNSSLSLSLGYEYKKKKKNSRTILGHTNFLAEKCEKFYF
jgi:hypothetical protein